MSQVFLEEIEDSITQINPKRNYWMVRTTGGDFYEDFLENNFIAIGWNKIQISDIKSGAESPRALVDLGQKIRDNYEDNLRPFHTAKQLIKFAYEIKKGDIVLIPSSSSSIVSFGEVLEDHIYIQEVKSDNPFVCTYAKRKKVKWIYTKDRRFLDPYLFKLLYSRQTITEAKSYDVYIDRTINSVYVKGERSHVVFDVKTKSGINARELSMFWNLLFDLAEGFGKEENIDINANEIEVKLNLQSPGTLEFISFTLEAITVIGLIIVAISGGGFEIKTKTWSVKLHTDGVIKKIQDYLNNKHRRHITESLTKHVENLQIKDPDDLIKILQELTKKQN